MSIILAIVVIGLAVMNYNRERQYMATFLSEKGSALIRAFEAGARTGMMGAFGTLPRLETLIQETAKQPDILYIAIVDQGGEVIAHNDTEKIGQIFLEPNSMKNLEAGKEVKWRTVDGQFTAAFEVYQLFLPVLPQGPPSHMMQMMRQRRNMMQNEMEMHSDTGWMRGLQSEKILHPDNRPVIVIGMDTTSFEEAMDEDIKLTVVISGILFLLGIAGVVSLFWAQSYARSKRIVSNIRAISSEMISNLPEGIILTDNDLNIRYINGIAEDLLGVNAQGAIGRNSQDILPAAINQMKIFANRNNKVIENEVGIKQLNGMIIPTSVIATEVVTSDGIFVGHMYLIKDLTQIKQLQSEIQRKDKLAAIGNLAAGVAHEVRNPLSSIKGYATYFKGLFAEDDENRAIAEILISETDRLNRVITELLEIARPSDIKPKEVDVQSIFETAIRLVQADWSQNEKTKISTEIRDGIETLFIDPDRFVQVLVNIYLNSLQAMPDGGLLKTEVGSDRDFIAISVTDTGRGMSQETKGQIFNPYFTTKNSGTGLGMAIVHKIIEAHNGRITVSSEEGKGTVITIYLPKNNN
jgi:two-component system sensor histidine kinase HydH